MSSPTETPPPSRLRLLAFSLLATSLGLLVLELVLAPFAPTGYAMRRVVEFDPGSFYVLDVNSEPHRCPFPRQKAAGELRVFTFGGSSTHGNPYGWNVSFSRLLARLLSDWYPDRRIRVVNLGFFAKTSSHAVDWAREAVAFSPDYFVFYSGHNEIYPYNVAADLRPRRFSALWHAGDFLGRRSHVFAAMDGLLRRFGRGSASAVLSDAVVSEEHWGFVLGNYRRNLEYLIDTTPPSTKIFLGTPVANLRTWHPPAPEWPLDGPSELYQDFLARTERGEDIDCDGMAREAMELWRGEPSTYAVASFWLGHCALADGSFGLGKKLLRDAAVADTTLGRVHNGILDLLRSRHLEPPNVSVLDFEALLEEQSPEGVVGHEWLVDWCHPSDRAHFEIALEIARHVARDQGRIPAAVPLEPVRTADEYLGELTAGSVASEGDSAMYALLWRQLDQAVRLVERVEERGLDSPRLRLTKALALWEMGEVDRSVEVLLRELEITPRDEAEAIVSELLSPYLESFYALEEEAAARGLP